MRKIKSPFGRYGGPLDFGGFSATFLAPRDTIEARVSKTWIATLASVLLLTASSVLAQSQPGYVLPPEAAPAIEKLLNSLGPGVVFDSASIEKDKVKATLCDAANPTACHRIVLEHSGGACPGKVAGEWCVTFAAPPLPIALQQQTLRALGSFDGAKVWQQGPSDEDVLQKLDESAPAATPAKPPATTEDWFNAWLLSAAMLLLPMVVGIGWGRFVARRIRWESGRSVALSWVALALVTPPILVSFLPAGFWDLFFVGSAALVGTARGLVPATRRFWPKVDALVVGGALIAYLSLELVLRLALQPLPPVGLPAPELEEAQVAPSGASEACAVLMADGEGEEFARRTANLLPDLPHILHLGDAMIYPWDIEGAVSVVEEVDRLDTTTSHVSAAVPAAGPSFHILAARKWVPLLQPTLVVVHLTLKNDAADMAMTLPCCGVSPLMTLGNGGPLVQCGEEEEGRNQPDVITEELASSMPAYPLRVLATVSDVARRLVSLSATFSQAAEERVAGQPYPANKATVLMAVTLLRDEVHAAGSRLVVVITPTRGSLDPSDPERSAKQKMVAVMEQQLKALKVPVLNANEPFQPETVVRELQTYFHDAGTHRNYLSREGHLFEAQWLAPRLREIALQPSPFTN